MPVGQHSRQLADGQQASTNQKSAHQEMPAASGAQEPGLPHGSWSTAGQQVSAAAEPAQRSAEHTRLQRQALAKLTRAVEQQPRLAAQASVEVEAAIVDSLAQRVRTMHAL